MKPFMQYKLVFANKAISSCFFYSFLIIDFNFLILVIIAQIFNSIVELIIALEISTKEANVEIEIETLTAKTKVRKYSIKFLFLLLDNPFWSISLIKYLCYNKK